MATTAKKDNFLYKLWQMAEDKLLERDMDKASKRLQRQAEIEVGKSLDAVENAESIFESAVQESLETGDFSKISNADLNVQTLTKVHKANLETYKKVFGENPKLV